MTMPIPFKAHSGEKSFLFVSYWFFSMINRDQLKQEFWLNTEQLRSFFFECIKGLYNKDIRLSTLKGLNLHTLKISVAIRPRRRQHNKMCLTFPCHIRLLTINQGR